MHRHTRMLFPVLASLMTGACATRGSLDVACTGFTAPLPGKSAFRRPLPLSPLEKQIRGLAGHPDLLTDGQGESGLLTRTLYAYQQAEMRQHLYESDPLKENPRLGNPAVLLLSGGGQWGAFGAGFLSRLAEKQAVPNFFVVTGVSTGSLQAMFVGSDDPDKWKWLVQAYTIGRESDVVNRNAKWRALLTGSFAGLKPLRKRVEQALCSSSSGELSCPQLKALGRTDRQILVGYIEARSGDFFYSDIHQIAHDADPANARSCVAATALASSAVPVTFQQVRINGRAYYDGGVRQSVFASFAEQLGRAVRAYETGRPMASVDDLPFYVIRNGPTDTPIDMGKGSADSSPDAFTAAQRAQAIVTNQLEVGSIAALRLQKPGGSINYISADGWRDHAFTTARGERTTCGAIKARNKNAMFDPAFMACLMDYGRERADAADPWTKLIAIGTNREAVLPPITPDMLPAPANDN